MADSSDPSSRGRQIPGVAKHVEERTKNKGGSFSPPNAKRSTPGPQIIRAKTKRGCGKNLLA